MKDNLSSQIVLTHVGQNLYQPVDVFAQSQITRLELIPTQICQDVPQCVSLVANRIADLIKNKQAKNQKAVLCFSLGRTMRDIFDALVKKHKEGLSFQNVVVFIAYEYFPLKSNTNGCLAQLKDVFVNHVDILPENVHALDGFCPQDKVLSHCENYERQIEEVGGIDFLLLGIGAKGNIAMNEPGTTFGTRTRLVLLDNNSQQEAKYLFDNSEQVPAAALTMGIDTILHAKEIVLVAFGEHKNDSIHQAIESPYTTTYPASVLQMHHKAEVIIDVNAANTLTRIQYPWIVTSCEWNNQLTRRAVVWLCQKTGKPILKLTNKDYNDNGLSELVTLYGSAYNCNIAIFNDLQHTITGWPGGKPNADDSNRPERATPYPKKVLIFSPHPDDDVISMGGTFSRLIKQGHDVHVAYETSGCIAVCDDEVVRFMDFMKGYKQLFLEQDSIIDQKYADYMKFFQSEKVGDQDTREILDIKALIRRGEATAACRFMGLPTDHIHFLNLPFYETGTIKKGPLTQTDVDIVKNILQEVKPDQIFAAGDLADPHGTHRVCLDAVLAALDELKTSPAWDEWLKNCRIWMYRGAWMEWEIDLIEMAVPLSPEELRFKRNTILKHQSQMESAPFMGNDERLFWQRAEDRNHATAELYSQLGLAEYEAIEAFVQYHIL